MKLLVSIDILISLEPDLSYKWDYYEGSEYRKSQGLSSDKNQSFSYVSLPNTQNMATSKSPKSHQSQVKLENISSYLS